MHEKSIVTRVQFVGFLLVPLASAVGHGEARRRCWHRTAERPRHRGAILPEWAREFNATVPCGDGRRAESCPSPEEHQDE